MGIVPASRVDYYGRVNYVTEYCAFRDALKGFIDIEMVTPLRR